MNCVPLPFSGRQDAHPTPVNSFLDAVAHGGNPQDRANHANSATPTKP
ncbi:hypothetical protein [Moorena sp. SIO4G3]|nr:hypothetical protein [Moorena sp. SIO4G3]NEO78384.1 hypothetical protein [Moorena sp. SIO4G3]